MVQIKKFFLAYREPLVIFTASRAVIFALVYLVTAFGFGDAHLAQWDARNYLSIAEHGYQFSGEYRDEGALIAFFPLYPILIRLVAVATGLGVYASGLLLSFFLGLAAALLLYRLTSRWHGRPAALVSVLLFSIFPTTVFISAPYSEGLFLVFTFAVLLFLENGRFGAAAVGIALAMVTRITGFLLVPIFLYELYRRRAHWITAMPYGIIMGLPFAGFLYFQYLKYGTPFAFLLAQKINWYHEATWPWDGLQRFMEYVLHDATLGIMWRMDFLMLFIMMGTMILATRKIKPTIAWLGWGVILLTSSQTFILGMSRYLMLVIPFYIFWGRILATRPLARNIVVIALASWMSLNTVLFSLSKWMF